MILDSSAILAILLKEPERAFLLEAIAKAKTIKVSSATILESSIVIQARHSREEVLRLYDFLIKAGAIEIPFSSEHRICAEKAFAIYGKGQHHKAKLNFGDCISYGLAKSTDEPLLYVGSDFTYTDIGKI